ncbi:barstar family protein [Streptomyces sp. NPDC127110]|uniref:barstar family protein n=1 Tax=Streptomyces sp. NPDC127110 TaxID=3345362 RepID=UPI003625838B
MDTTTDTPAPAPAPAPTLTERRSPWVVFTRRDDPWVTDGTAALRARGGRVFRLDGREMREPAPLFAAFARALSFPGYFGRNWPALVDCLHDWHGHGADSKDIAVLIDHADALLDAEFTGLFVSVLCEAAWKANLQLDADGIPHEDWPPFTLHFVFLLEHVPPAAFAPAAARDADVGVALVDGRLTATLTGDDWPEAAPAR